MRYGLQEVRLTPGLARPAGAALGDRGRRGRPRGGVRRPVRQPGRAGQPDAGSIRDRIHSRGEVETADTGGVTAVHLGFTPLWLFLRPTTLTRPRSGRPRSGPAGRLRRHGRRGRADARTGATYRRTSDLHRRPDPRHVDGRGGARGGSRRLPGPRPPLHQCRPRARSPGTLRERLSHDGRSRRPGGESRMGRGVDRRAGLGRVRRLQRHLPRRSLRPGCHRARLRRGCTDLGCPEGAAASTSASRCRSNSNERRRAR